MVTRPHDNYTPPGAAAAPGVRMFHNLANRVLGTFRGQTAEPDMHIFVTRDVVRKRDGSISLAGSSAATWVAAAPAPHRNARRNAMAAPLGATTVWAGEQQWEQENVGPTGVARARAQTLAKLTGQTIDPLASTSAATAHRSSHRPSVPDLRTVTRDLDLDATPKNRRTRDTLQTSYTTDSIDTSASAMWRRRQRVQSESGSAPTSLVGPWQQQHQARPTYFDHERVTTNESFTVGIGDIDEDDEADYDEIPFLPDETPLPVRDSLPHSVSSTFGSQSRRSSGEGTYTERREHVPPVPRDWRRENEVLMLAGLSGAPTLQLHRSASMGNGRMRVHSSGPAGAGPAGRRVLGVVNQTSQPQLSQQRNVYGPHSRHVDTMNYDGHPQPMYEDWYDPRRRSRPTRVTSMSSNAAVAYFPLG